MFRDSARISHQPPLLLCFLWFLLALPVPAQAQALRLRIATLELGACGHLEKGRPVGFCYELGEILARAAGMEPVNHLVPLARGLDEIASGAADMIIMPPEADIADLAEDIGRVKPVTMVAWARVETPLRDVRDLGGKTVAVIRGSRHELDQAKKFKFIPFPCKNHELGFKMLMAGRVDAVLGPLQGLTAEAGRLGLRRRFLGEPLVLGRDDMRVYASRRLPEDVRGRLKAALDRLIEDGSVARLRDKYPL
ncbi:extracellular solute-binding protein family 3 [Pseudodesulfovibrio mercurii]|uniref:Extracellular solute-binding protein family 3 n=1 Tax=Pseudodesulfovibrio mercurii TaxID=641491 RepID=F0JGA9_9BACT|nr:transporter substrate-binding domain-containing protein [Pseudodesulfovibrio mercurii]EGB15026.1 extracellular solute-binding protein family 3 [Pseudodesulfovibrio mercurii]